MSSAIVLNEKLENVGALALPASFEEIHSHNLYLYVKSYQAALRSNTAHSKTKGDVSGGGKNHGLKKVVVVRVLVVEEVQYGLAVVLHSDQKLTEIMI